MSKLFRVAVIDAHPLFREGAVNMLTSVDDIEVVGQGATADDGRTCAFEYTLTKMNGRPVAPQAGLAVYERGDSGLLRALRVYDDLES